MGGQSGGYSNGGMQPGYGGYSSGGGYGQQSSGYGNGGYQPGMNSGSYGGGYNNNFSNRMPMYGQQSNQYYGGSGGSQQPMSYDAYMQAHAGQPIQSSDYGNYVQGFNQSQNQQPFTGRGGGTYTPGMNLFGNGGGNQYGNPFGQFMQQWPQFNRQFQGGYAGGNMSQGNFAGIGQDAPYQPPSMYQNPMNLGAMTGGNMGAGNMINPNGVGDPSQNYRQQMRLQAGPQYETTGIVPPGGMTQNNGQLDYATQQQPFGGGF